MTIRQPSLLKALVRPAMIFIPFGLGVFFPQAHVLAGEPFNAVRWALVVMVFISCLQLRAGELKLRREHWIVLSINLAMGVIPFLALRWLLPSEPELARAAFFVGITPTATAAPVVVAFLNGRIGFALTGFTVTNVFISAALLFLLPVVVGDFSVGFVVNAGGTLLMVTALPFAAAALLRAVWPGARELPKKCRTFTFSLWSFMLFLLAAVAREHFVENPSESVAAAGLIAAVSLVLCAAGFAVGGMVARRRYARESSQILGQKNTTFSIYLALHYAGALAALGPIFYVFWHNSWNAWQMYRYDRRRILRGQKK